MGILTALVLIVPSVLSCLTTAAHLYWDYKKSKEPPKDEAWETAVRIFAASDEPSHLEMDVEEFAKLYASLRFMRDHWDKMRGYDSLEEAITAYTRSRQQPQAEADTAPVE